MQSLETTIVLEFTAIHLSTISLKASLLSVISRNWSKTQQTFCMGHAFYEQLHFLWQNTYSNALRIQLVPMCTGSVCRVMGTDTADCVRISVIGKCTDQPNS